MTDKEPIPVIQSIAAKELRQRAEAILQEKGAVTQVNPIINVPVRILDLPHCSSTFLLPEGQEPLHATLSVRLMLEEPPFAAQD